MRLIAVIFSLVLLCSGTATAQNSCEPTWQSAFPIAAEQYYPTLDCEGWYSFTVTRPTYVTPTVQYVGCSREKLGEFYFEEVFIRPALDLYSECIEGGYMSRREYGSTQQLLLTPGIYYFRFHIFGYCFFGYCDGGGKSSCNWTRFYDDEGGLVSVRFVATASPYVDVEIVPESINPRGYGVIPVALLGGEYLRMDEVDVRTLRFGPDEALPAHDLNDDWIYNEHLEDVNLDGFMDLMTHFRTQNTGIACGDTEASLTGSMLTGESFEGADSIETVGCPPRARAQPV